MTIEFYLIMFLGCVAIFQTCFCALLRHDAQELKQTNTELRSALLETIKDYKALCSRGHGYKY